MKVAIIYYSTYGHVLTMAESVKAGIEKTGKASEVTIFQVPETLPKEVLDKMHAPSKSSYPIADQKTLVDYDAFVFGYPTRFGNLPAQLTEYLGQTGGLWASGALAGKPVTFFTSVSTSAGGQETTLRNFIPYVAHHGLVYIPLGYGAAFPDLTNLDEIHGGSPYGAATFAGSDGSRTPTDLEKRIAFVQGEVFAKSAAKLVAARSSSAPNTDKSEKLAKPAPVAENTAETTAEKTAAKTSEPAPALKPAETARTTQSKPVTKLEEKSGCAKCVIV